jgi:hypothetical protein
MDRRLYENSPALNKNTPVVIQNKGLPQMDSFSELK